jgi:hypothetical protein
MKRIIPLVLLLVLAGCTNFQSNLTKANTWANTYGPIIGKDLIMVANILVQAECSPALGTTTATAQNILKVVAPNSSSAQTVGNVLASNYAVAQQLCPLIASIKTSVGAVPNGTPSQVIPGP